MGTKIAQILDQLADHLVEFLVPNTSAAACICNDSYCTSQICEAELDGRVRVVTNCNCTSERYICTC
jgi:hypothetical protein